MNTGRNRNFFGTLVMICVIVLVAGVAHADIIHGGGTITGNSVWSGTGEDHVVTGNITIASGASLTIQAGCVVKFDYGMRLTVRGILNIPGTVADGVLLTRRDPSDEWSGLLFDGGSSGSLEYCTIEHVTRFDGIAVYANGALPSMEHCTLRDNDTGLYLLNLVAPTLSVNNVFENNTITGIHVNGCTNPSISNQTITGHNSLPGALYMHNTGSFHLGGGNSITGNIWGLSMNLGSYPDAGSAGNIPMAGNTNSDGLRVNGGTLSGPATWYDVGADYIVTGSPTINAAGALEIRPAVTVKFDFGLRLTNRGVLNIPGTVADGVLLTRRDPSDEWSGLLFDGGSSGSLEYCTIEHVTRFDGIAVYANGALPSMEHCTLRDNDTGLYLLNLVAPTLSVNNIITNNTITGIHVSGCTNPSISNQTITGHNSLPGALYMHNTGSFHLGGGNNITGNIWGLSMNMGSYPDAGSAGNIPMAGNTNSDGLRVNGGTLSGPATWYDVGADYIVTGSPTINAAGALEIRPAVTVKFDFGLRLTNRGVLNIPGTVADGVLLTRRDSSDEWSGLLFDGGSSGSLEYCTIEHVTRFDGIAVYANGALPSMEHCTLRDNDTGLYLLNLVAPTLSVNNVFENNTITGIHVSGCTNPSISNQTITGHNSLPGALYMHNTGSFHLGGGNNITGNIWGLSMNLGSYPDAGSAGNIPMAGNTNSDGLRVNGGTLSGPATWYDVGADYIVTGSPTINAAGALEIRPAVTVKFDFGLRLTNRGVLNIPGTVADGVLLTRRDPTDEWSGLLFDGGSSGSLEYCTIEHVTRFDGVAVYANGSDVVYLDHCVLRQNDYGLYVRDSSPDLVNCKIIDNNLYGIYLTGACSPSFGTSLSQWNDIYDNGGTEPDRDLRNGTLNVYARYVYWGTVTQSAIEDRIRHRPDNEDLGQVYFSPWTNAAHDTEYSGGPSGVEDDPEILLPTVFRLAQNYPNPFNPTTTISYDLPVASQVELTVMDVAGRRLVTLVDEHQDAGFKSIPWDAQRFGSGMYLYRIKAGEFAEIKKMTLVR